MDPLDREQEALDGAVAALPEAQRQLFYDRSEQAFKDPDTYATLAYMFVAGLHHFYLQRWGRGALDLGLNLTGFVLVGIGVVTDNTWVVLAGTGIVVAVGISELSYLFRSQSIVRRYNLNRQRELLGAVQSELAALPRSERP